MALGEVPIGSTRGDDGVARLLFGPGTVADRIEFAGADTERRIVDVRGAELDAAGGCWFHVLRPTDETPGGPLEGVRWPCYDMEAEAAATEVMRARLSESPAFSRMRPEARARALAGFVERNDCSGCHQRGRPDAATRGERGAVHRGTDASGFFTPPTMLRDTAPIEPYGAFDPNLDDPAIEIACPADDLERHGPHNGGTRVRCGDGRVPVGKLDWSLLWTRDSQRAKAICRGRRWLIGHMDAGTRAIHAGAVDPCERDGTDL